MRYSTPFVLVRYSTPFVLVRYGTPFVLYVSRLTSENEKLWGTSLRGFLQDSVTLSPYVQTALWTSVNEQYYVGPRCSVTRQWQQNRPVSVSTVNVSQSATALPCRLRPCHRQCEVKLGQVELQVVPRGQTALKYKRPGSRGHQRIGVRQTWSA